MLLENIIATVDPVLHSSSIQMASKFLAERGSHEAALALLINSGKYDEVIKTLEANEMAITEASIEKLLQGVQENENSKILFSRLGDICVKQGYFQHASKCYTASGEKLKAMGALLKTGDKDKIIMFASKRRI